MFSRERKIDHEKKPLYIRLISNSDYRNDNNTFLVVKKIASIVIASEVLLATKNNKK